MAKEYSRIELRKKSIEKLNSILDHENKILIIHYSCESFYNIPNGKSARITSIAVRYFDTGQDVSFSIHKTAELKKIPFEDITNRYDEIEKDLLSDFFEFVNKHKGYYYFHWNMRDVNFGFEALKHRFEVLGGVPIDISNYHRIDIARLVIDKYGPRYIGHPRLEKLIEKNKISNRDFLSGADEALAFEQKRYVELHKSTLKKVDIINNLVIRAVNDTLVHDAKLKDVYGLSASGVLQLIKDNPFLTIAIWLLGIGLGAVITVLIS